MTNEKEIWKAIEGFEDSYEVSNLGRVRSLDRRVWITRGQGYYMTIKGKILSPFISRSNKRQSYKSIGLVNEKSIRTTHTIAHLVAQAFVSNPNNYNYIEHIDKNCMNDNAGNLRWVKEISVLKENNHKRKQKVKCIETGEVFESLNVAGRKFNIRSSRIAYAIQGKPGFRSVRGYHFEYIKEEFKDDINK